MPSSVKRRPSHRVGQALPLVLLAMWLAAVVGGELAVLGAYWIPTPLLAWCIAFSVLGAPYMAATLQAIAGDLRSLHRT